jgi:hypothetical protein
MVQGKKMPRICNKSGLVSAFGIALAAALATAAVCGCNSTKQAVSAAPATAPVGAKADPPVGYVDNVYRGFDRNDYPGDSTMQALHGTFAFTGYWITPPPEERSNSWLGKRATLRQQGWGFLVLANGRLDKEILRARKAGTTPAQLGKNDAQVAVAAAQTEGFPAGTILFLDQEEGGALLEEQAGYLLGWTEAVAASSYKPGVYASGQPVPDGPPVSGKQATIDTIQHVRALVKAQHLHEIAAFDYQDACPPAPGCTLAAKPLSAAGEPDLIVWQYAQSPRRPEITKACAKTYSADGNCNAPGFPTVFLDLDAATTADPSNGR